MSETVRSPGELAEPSRNACLCSPLQVCAQRGLLDAQLGHIDVGLRQLKRVADQPALESVGAGFGVELNGQRVLAVGERLILAYLREGEPDPAFTLPISYGLLAATLGLSLVPAVLLIRAGPAQATPNR